MDKLESTMLAGAGKNVSGNFTMLTEDALLSYGGTFAGETFILTVLENGIYEPVIDGTMSAAGQKLLRLARGKKIRVTTSNGAGSPSINVSVSPRY